MNKQISKTSHNSRREFLKNASGALFYFSIPVGLSPLTSCEEGQSKENSLQAENKSLGQPLNVWVQIHDNDQITIFNPTNEMGQGSMTALAVIVAEELDADWSKVKVEYTPIDPDIFGSQGWGGNKIMMTVGSRTVNTYFDMLRQAGAQARFVLLNNVANHWGVHVNELVTEPNKVIHPKTKKEISYGEIASFMKPLEDIPNIPEDQLKDPKNFRLIGQLVERIDIPAKVDGSAMYAMDIQVPDMVYGVIARSPVHGSKPELINEKAIRSMAGIVEIAKLEHGIGVIATSIEQAIKAKDKLQIKWSEGAKAESHNSKEAYAEYEKIATDSSFKGEYIVNKGDVESSFKSATKTYKIDYKNDYVCHAQMEPLNAIVSLAKDQSSVEVWVGTQAPGFNRLAIAKVLEIDESKVTIHRQYLGGGFGRRSNPDWILETVELAKFAKKPVKLIWSREDDIQYGMFRPISLQRMQASVGKSGKITAWKHTIVGTGGGLLSSGAETHNYTFPNQKIELRNIDAGIRTKHWRAVGHGPNKFAIEAFIDEIATDQGINPLDFRLELMKDYPRAQKVLQTAAEMSNWNTSSPKGRAKGIAFAERSNSLGACVCEISVDQETGIIKVHHIWSALDAGIVVQPDNVIAQMEGGFLMGMSSVLKESITIKNGVVQESNFHDYQILRMNEIPESIEVKIIPSSEKPTGVGESAVPLIGGAIANAFASLTGKKIRHLPFTPKKVLSILNN